MAEFVTLARPRTRADLTHEWRKRVCLIGQHEKCCRYLTCNAQGFDCEKHSAELREVIDAKVANGEFTARADNCPGLEKP